MGDFIPDCRGCEDGNDLFRNERCPFCGRRGKKERAESRRRYSDVRQELIRKIHGSQFQESVRLARQTFQIPETGLSRQVTFDRLFNAYWACFTTYLWTLEPFQNKVLDIDEQEKREQYFRQTIGAQGHLLAYLSYPDNRAGFLDLLMAAKLIAARLCSRLGVDNVPEMSLYLICPELSPPESWQFRPVKERKDDPLLRQLEHFVRANLLLPEELASKQNIREFIGAAAYFGYQISKGQATWEENRRVLASLFPSLGSEYTKKHQVRVRRAAKKFRSYEEVLSEMFRRIFK